ncbi:MAG TPA: hypothetical protein VFN07_01900 [Trueperaceae bacterium]|nr:hypothetical protein [Trueperaceae bacterium]
MKLLGITRSSRLATAAIGLALISTLVACGGADGQPTTPAGQVTAARPNADELLSVMLSPAGPDSAAAALARLPRPASSSTRRVLSHHGGAADVTVSEYDGLSVTTYQALGASPLLIGVEMTSGAAPLHGMTVGMSAAAAQSYLGGASKLPAAPGASASYSVTTDPLAAPYQVDLVTSGGVVTGVTWSAYLD